jgi:antitoxin component YwqK of YwqJK toxin-antitoxin module
MKEDIIIVALSKNLNTIKLNFDEYSSTLIKSGFEFNINEIFKIKNIKIEGLFIEQKIYPDNKVLTVFFVENCQVKGRFTRYITKDFNKEHNYYFENNKFIIKDAFIILDCYYDKGLLNGRYFESSDGYQKIENYYKNGKREGPSTTWNGDNILHTSNYKEDKRHGKSTYYYENGNKKFEKNYNNGILNGKYTTWNENGEITNTSYYVNNTKSD